MEEAILIWAFLSIPLLGLAHGHILKLLFIRTVRLRKGRLFEPTRSDIFVEMKGPKKGKKYDSRPKDFGLLHLRSGYLEVEMQDHRLKLSSQDISVSSGKGWEFCGDHVRISCGAEPLGWEVTLLPFFQGINIGVFGAAITSYRWLLKRITEGIGCCEKYTFSFRKAIIVIVAFLGLLHSVIPLMLWAMAIALFAYERAWPLLGFVAHGIPALLLFVGFLGAYICARKQSCCALYFLVWSVLALAIFFVYDVTNQNYQSGHRGKKTYFYVNWPFYRGSVDTWRTGYINRAGEYVLRDVPYWRSFSEGLLPVEVDEKWGYIDISGECVIQPRFEYANKFSDGLAIVSMDNKCGYIDKMGNFVIEPRFDSAEDFSEGLASVTVNGKWGYINKHGTFEIEAQFDWIRNFSEGLAAVEVDSKWGFIDRHGEVIVEPQYDHVREFREGLAAVEIDGKWGYVGKVGELVVKPIFERAGSFSGGLAAVKTAQKYGYADTSGKVAISARFDDCVSFSEGLACVKLNDKYGYIDSSGEVVIEPQFHMPSVFRDGLALVSIIKRFGYEEKRGYINTSGEFVIEPVFYDASRFSDGVAWVKTIDGLGRGVTYGMVAGLGVMVFGVYRFRMKRR